MRNMRKNGNLRSKKRHRDYDKLRGTRTERMYDNRWLRYSKAYRARNPLCVVCEEKGIVTLVQCVDHKTPHGGDSELFWDPSNHQSLCKSCHGEKTAREDGAFGNAKRR